MYNGMYTLHQDSMKKARAGLSTIQEALTNCPPDMEDLDAMKEEFELQRQLKEQAEQERKAKIDALRLAKQQTPPAA